MGLRKFAGNVFSLTIAEVAGLIISFFWIVCLTRKLGEKDFGIYSTVAAFVGLFGIIPNLGVGTIIIRDVARNRSKTDTYLSGGLCLCFFLSSLTIVLIIIIAYLLDYSKDIIILTAMAGLTIVFNSIGTVGNNLFIGFERMKLVSLFNISVVSFPIILGLIVLLYGYGLFGVFAARLIAAICVAFFIWWVTLKNFSLHRPLLDLNVIRYLFKEGLPIGLASLFFLIYDKVDRVMLSKMMDFKAVGGYSAAAVLIQPIISIIWVPYVNAIFPVMSRFYKSNIEKFNWLCRKTVSFILAVTFPVVIGGTILGDRIIFFLYKGYENSIVVFQILLWSITFMVLSAFFYRVLMVLGKQKLFLAISFLGVVINISLNFLLIPKYGYIGASVATVVTQLTLVLVYLQVVYKDFQIFEWGKILRIIIACGLMAVLIYLFRGSNLALIMISSIIVYLTFLLTFKVFSKEDMIILQRKV